MNQSDLCPGKPNVVWEQLPAGKRVGIWPTERPTGIKRKRLKCPRCGRRVLSSVAYYHDGDYIIHSIPPHKPKGYFKRAKVGHIEYAVVKHMHGRLC